MMIKKGKKLKNRLYHVSVDRLQSNTQKMILPSRVKLRMWHNTMPFKWTMKKRDFMGFNNTKGDK